MNQIEELKKGLNSKERKMFDEVMETFRGVTHAGVVQAISELQILEAQLAEKDFVLSDREEYTEHQRTFLNGYVKSFVAALIEMQQEQETAK
jgi:hypothetical protein